MDYVAIGDDVVPARDVIHMNLEGMSRGQVIALVRGVGPVKVSGHQAVDLVMRVCPQALEGRRLRWARHAWAFHNLIAHPLLQILAWVGLTKLGIKVHDMTIPRPR